MEYAAVYFNDRKGPIFDGSPISDKSDVLGVITVKGRPSLHPDEDAVPIVSVCLTRHGDIAEIWHDEDAKADEANLDTVKGLKTQLLEMYSDWTVHSQDAPCVLLYLENSDTACTASVRQFRSRTDAKQAMALDFQRQDAILNFPPEDPNAEGYDSETACTAKFESGITVHNGLDVFRWLIASVPDTATV